jgi:cyanophycinase-like exopeptidase
MTTTWWAGSLEVVASHAELFAPREADVCVVTTAAYFTGMTEAAVRCATALESTNWRIEALMVGDRTAANDDYFAARVATCDLVITTDGAALHARSVWRHSALGASLVAHPVVIGVGASASVLGDFMIDPRGGAPTSGLSRFTHVAVATASDDVARTRSLLVDDVTLVVGDASTLVRLDDAGHQLVAGQLATY